MVDSKISNLPQQTTPSDIVELIINDAGTSKKVVKSDLFATIPASQLTGAMDCNNQAMTNIDVNSGAIDGVTLGTNSPVTEAQIDNININGNTISSTDTNGDISLEPNGSGNVVLSSSNLDITGGRLNVNRSGDAVDSEIVMTAGEAKDVVITLAADEGDDNADLWQIVNTASDNELKFKNYSTGTYVSNFNLTSGGKAELPNDTLAVGRNATWNDANFISYADINAVQAGELGGFCYLSCGSDNGRVGLRFSNGAGSSSYLWVDDTGAYRQKASTAPTSDTDGTLI